MRSSIKVANRAMKRQKTTQNAEDNNFVRSILQSMHINTEAATGGVLYVKNGVLKNLRKIHKKKICAGVSF